MNVEVEEYKDNWNMLCVKIFKLFKVNTTITKFYSTSSSKYSLHPS